MIQCETKLKHRFTTSAHRRICLKRAIHRWLSISNSSLMATLIFLDASSLAEHCRKWLHLYQEQQQTADGATRSQLSTADLTNLYPLLESSGVKAEGFRNFLVEARYLFSKEILRKTFATRVVEKTFLYRSVFWSVENIIRYTSYVQFTKRTKLLDI